MRYYRLPKIILTGFLLPLLLLLVSNEGVAEQKLDLDFIELAEYGSSCTQTGINPTLILSIILKEGSKGNPYALNINGVGSFHPSSMEEAKRILHKYDRANTDIGLMQVNFLSWAVKFRVAPKDLMDPWINVCVGSKVLEYYINRYGYRGIGRYNAITPWKQLKYMKNIEKIQVQLEEILDD